MAAKNKALTEEQKQEIKHIVRIQAWIGLGIVFTLLSGILGYSLRDIKSHVEKKVEDLVAKQFEEPRIKEIVENAAKNKASALMSEQINPEVAKFKEDMAQKIIKADVKSLEMDAQIRNANETIKNLDLYSQYYLIVLAAQGENRMAYDQLYKWSKDVNSPFRPMASNIYAKIMDDHSNFRSIFASGFEVHWKEGVDPSKLTLEQLKQYFSQLNQDPYERRALLEYIYNRSDIPKVDRLDFFIDVLRNDNHLMVCEYAGRYFNELAGLKIKPLAFDIYLFDWWKDNKAKFEVGPDPNSKK